MRAYQREGRVEAGERVWRMELRGVEEGTRRGRRVEATPHQDLGEYVADAELAHEQLGA
jgi:hypothetical protein